jgi:hypothetical protein
VKPHALPLFLALAVLVAALSPPPVLLAQAPRAERPAYAVGDTWVLKDAAYRLARVTRDGYVFTAGDREIWLTRDVTITYVKRGAETLEIQNPPRLTWPLEVGKRGVGRAIIRVASIDIEVYTTWRVEAAEKVTTAGGAFDAFRIRYVFDPEIPGQFGTHSATLRYGPAARQAAFEVTWWYAPEPQRIVKATSSKELLTFELGGGPPAIAQTPAAPPSPPPAAPPAPAPALPPPAPARPSTPPPAATPAPPAPAERPHVEPPRPAPLTIAIRHPAEGARVSDPSTIVAAVVSSGPGVGAVSVTLNGAEVTRQTEPTPQSTVVLTTPVTLREGLNTIVLTALAADGTVRQETRTVTLERPAVAAVPPAPPTPPAPASRDGYAVVIGVGRYESPSIPSLRYTVADAEAMYRVLTETAGFRKDRVLLLTDRSERKPTLRNIKYALGTFLARAAQKDDTVIVYFAGHGAPEVDQRGLERDGLAKYLIPSDADPDDLFSTALPMDDLQTIFGRIEAERVVVFLDACYSGAAGGRTFASRKTRSVNVDDLFLERLTRSKGRAIITASAPTEVSIELPELGHGIFTYYLTEGLRGAGDLNRDGIVSLQELYEYVEQQVVRKSRSVGGNQHPVMKGELEGVLPLTRVRAR